MKRALFLLMLAPALLAPVRLKDATPGFFEPPAQGPAPESYSLPPAEPLVSVTVIPVSPTILSPTVVAVTPSVVTSTLSLPLAPSPTQAVTPVVVIQQVMPDPNVMTDLQAALCFKALSLVEELAQLSYGQKPARSVMTLNLAAGMAMQDVQSMRWPEMAAFKKAAGNLPLIQPQKAEMKDGSAAALRLCVNPRAVNKVSVPRPE